MGQKQILKRTQIAKMLGHETTNFFNPRSKRIAKLLADLGGLQHLGSHLVTLPVGSVASKFHRHVCAEECVYIIASNGTARIGPDMFEIEDSDFIVFPADGEAHDLCNTGSSPMTCIVFEQPLDFDVVEYSEQNNRLYRYAGKAGDLVDIAAVSHPILPDARQ
ncbi:cupin domain-containing protein [Alphaproteobacteria bacterium]|nr:cupin domain-containing protein [Alphaproteobacteria bacterium]